jgi:hypothetical protein
VRPPAPAAAAPKVPKAPRAALTWETKFSMFFVAEFHAALERSSASM